MYEVIVSNYFARQVKRLAKKNQNLKETLRDALYSFDKKQSISIGQGVYKIRLASKSKGKSGGYRMYVYIIEINKILTPIAIYAKNEMENLSLNEMCTHLKNVKNEFLDLLN